MEVRIHIYGGARGNPGPAGAGVVIETTDDGTVLFAGGFYLGRATNNVAEYTGLIRGLERAAALGATAATVRSDSELLVRQMNGKYRVRNAGLRPLFEQACELRGRFDQFDIAHVYREDNTEADRLVNQAIDARRNVEDADQT
jgi:ribonuclease HI